MDHNMATPCFGGKFCVGLFGCIFQVTSILWNSLGDGKERNLWHRRLLGEAKSCLLRWVSCQTRPLLSEFRGACGGGVRDDNNTVTITVRHNTSSQTTEGRQRRKSRQSGWLHYFHGDRSLWVPLRHEGNKPCRKPCRDGVWGQHAHSHRTNTAPFRRVENKTEQNEPNPRNKQKGTKRQPPSGTDFLLGLSLSCSGCSFRSQVARSLTV